MPPHRPAWLSPSALRCYATCPGLYAQRYLQRTPASPNQDMAFGSAVHAGLEALYRGQDAETAFLTRWRKDILALREAGVPVYPYLTRRGLDLIARVESLDLSGEPERQVWVRNSGTPVPLMGYVDLWDRERRIVTDFKTANVSWSQKTIDTQQLWQQVIYSQAFAEAHDGEYPTFRFVVLTRTGPTTPQIIDATPTIRQIAETFERVREIARAIEAQEFDCKCKDKGHAT